MNDENQPSVGMLCMIANQALPLRHVCSEGGKNEIEVVSRAIPVDRRVFFLVRDAVGNVSALEVYFEESGRELIATPLVAELQADVDAPGIRAAARFVANRRDGYELHYGIYDATTGVTEYPGTGDEYVQELTVIEEGILALIGTHSRAERGE